MIYLIYLRENILLKLPSQQSFDTRNQLQREKQRICKRRQSCLTKRWLADDAVQDNVEMELIHKGNLLIEKFKSCQTNIATP